MSSYTTILILLVVGLVHHFATASLIPQSSSEHDQLNEAAKRFRRKIGSYTGVGPVEYMERLRNQMISTDGSVDKDSPTSVWCLLDRDVVNDQFHPKPINKQCQLKHKFTFNLTTLAIDNPETFPLSKAILRMYFQPTERFLPANNTTVDVIATVYTKAVSSLNHTGCRGQFIAAERTIKVNSSFQSQWLELDVKDGILSCWNNATQKDKLEVTVELKLAQCKSEHIFKKKVPISIVDPATIPISQEVRRNRHWALQPMIILYFDNEDERNIIKQSLEPKYPALSVEDEKISINKRSANIDEIKCRRENLTITFAELKMHHILAPNSYTANQCVGDCSHSIIKFSHASNHARILAAAHSMFEPTKDFKPRKPCCVAVQHKGQAVLRMKSDGNLANVVYNDMTALKCACRA
jgi:hypothetical protein